MTIIRILLLFAALSVVIGDGGPGMDPNGGGAMDPNGGSTAAAGCRGDYTACVDPNG